MLKRTPRGSLALFFVCTLVGATFLGLLAFNTATAEDNPSFQAQGLEFPASIPSLKFHFKAKSTGPNQSIWGVWIAEDVGDTAPPNFQIDAAELPLPGPMTGTFSLSRPDNGWPLGQYRLEVRLGPKGQLDQAILLFTERFAIK